MGIFTRFRDIISSNINAMLDKAEDPAKLIRLMIREMEDTLIEIKSSCAAVMAERKKIEQELDDLNGELDVYRKKSDDLKASIEKDLLERYLFLWERKQGVAISPVAEGVCQTCHMGIPPQKFNELIRGDALMSCSNCKRIIYWADDAHYQGTAEAQEEGRPETQQEG